MIQILASIDPGVLHHDQQLQAEIGAALEEVQAYLARTQLPWCLPRSSQPSFERDLFDCKTPRKLSSSSHAGAPDEPYGNVVPLVLSPLIHANRFASLVDLKRTAIFNPTCRSSAVILPDDAYLVPPSSCFILATIEAGLLAFEVAISIVSARFDLILMDPPWTNRSVRHSKTYLTAESQTEDPFVQTLPIMRRHLDRNGTVAIWVTIKIAVRAQVERVLDAIDLHLCEEWIWTKITSQGEPVTTVNGVWRKPYETLLIFKHSKRPTRPSRRFIFAVPDVHSRKPSLKQLFAEFMPPQYRALELFARSLTAGWWSWGDEVLKFQHSKEWTKQQGGMSAED